MLKNFKKVIEKDFRFNFEIILINQLRLSIEKSIIIIQLILRKIDRSVYNHQKQIDLILDKISKSGYESLTKEKGFSF